MADSTDSVKIKRLEKVAVEGWNYHTWLIDIKALLRRRKLWQYTQNTKQEADSALQKDYDDKVIDAADLITPFLGEAIKNQLSPEDFDNGYEMLAKIKNHCQPDNDVQFFALHREIFSLEYETRDPDGHIAKIKQLNQRIENTKIEMDSEKRALLCLSMSCAKQHPHMVQIWSVTKDMTFEKACTMLREEGTRERTTNTGLSVRIKENKECKHCHKLHRGKCWTKYPHLAPWNNDNDDSSSSDEEPTKKDKSKKQGNIHHGGFRAIHHGGF